MENNNLAAHPLKLPAANSGTKLWLLGCARKAHSVKVWREARGVANGRKLASRSIIKL